MKHLARITRIFGETFNNVEDELGSGDNGGDISGESSANLDWFGTRLPGTTGLIHCTERFPLVLTCI